MFQQLTVLRATRTFIGLHHTLWERPLSPSHVAGFVLFGSSEQQSQFPRFLDYCARARDPFCYAPLVVVAECLVGGTYGLGSATVESELRKPLMDVGSDDDVSIGSGKGGNGKGMV